MKLVKHSHMRFLRPSNRESHFSQQVDAAEVSDFICSSGGPHASTNDHKPQTMYWTVRVVNFSGVWQDRIRQTIQTLDHFLSGVGTKPAAEPKNVTSEAMETPKTISTDSTKSIIVRQGFQRFSLRMITEGLLNMLMVEHIAPFVVFVPTNFRSSRTTSKVFILAREMLLDLIQRNCWPKAQSSFSYSVLSSIASLYPFITRVFSCA